VTIELSVSKLRRALLAMWALLAAAGFAVEAWKYLLRGSRQAWVYFFGLSYEANFPTWYSSCLLLLCSFHLGLIGLAARRRSEKFVLHWWTLAAGFLYISLDETVQLHEHVSKWFNFGGGFLYFGWVVPASIVVAVIGLSYTKFLAYLPARPRLQFIVAGALYVGGALGVEFFLGYWTEHAGTRNLGYGLIDWVQESLELLGATLFLCALVEYLGGSDGQIRVSLTEPELLAISRQSAPG